MIHDPAMRGLPAVTLAYTHNITLGMDAQVTLT